jgi:excisionase family DNA binding protein
MSTLTTAEVSELLRVSIWTVREWRQKGYLKGMKIGRTIRFERSEVERAVRCQETGPSEPTPAA